MQQENMAAVMGENVHKLPLEPVKKQRVSKAMRALLETTVTEAEERAYARGFEVGGGDKFLVLIVGVFGGGLGGFLIGLLVHFAAK